MGNSFSSVNFSLLSVFNRIFSGFKSVWVSDYEWRNSIALRDYRLISLIWSMSKPKNNVVKLKSLTFIFVILDKIK